MSGDWIKMRTSLPRNPKVVRLSVTLKAHASAVCGACFVLWALADEHSEDGRLPGYTYEVIDSVVGIPGFCEAASEPEVGWVARNAQGVILPRFSDHNGATAKRRANGSKRANKLREKASRTRNAASVTKCAPREEKRREEKTEGASAPSGGSKLTLVEAMRVATPIGWTPDMLALWGDWLAVRCVEKRTAPTLRALELAIGELERWRREGGHAKATEAMKNAVVGGWQGLHEPSGRSKPNVNGHRERKRDSEYAETLELPINRFPVDASQGGPTETPL